MGEDAIIINDDSYERLLLYDVHTVKKNPNTQDAKQEWRKFLLYHLIT